MFKKTFDLFKQNDSNVVLWSKALLLSVILIAGILFLLVTNFSQTPEYIYSNF